MVLLSDQFEVEPRGYYSGSYNDIVTYRDMIVSTSMDMYVTTSFVRGVIASKIFGPTSKLQEKKVLYSFVLDLVSGSTLGSSVNFVQAASQEQFFDSFGPNIVDIYRENGVNTLVFNFFSPNVRPLIGDSDFSIASAPTPQTIYLVYSDGPNFFSGYGKLSDNVWPSSFPFEGKYRRIRRILTPSNKLPNKITAGQGLFGFLSSPVEVDTIGGVALYHPRPPNSSVTPIQYIMDVALAPSNSLPAIVQGGNFNSGSGTVIKYNQGIRTGYEIIAKTVYGFGDGILTQGTSSVIGATNGFSQVVLRKKFPGFRDWFDSTTGTGTPSAGSGAGVYHFGPILRGTKYGMSNPIPTSTKCIYRLGRYGQVRDMLEQRPFTKFYQTDPINGRRFVGESVVTIRFKAGTTIASASNVELRATGSVYFNPTDSGQFNFEYRSGQPFFDNINLESYRNF